MQPHVVVVGAGFAGATAAVRLVEHGFRVTLVEARAEAGGRVQSLYDSTTGEIIDNGQHLMMGCYDAALRLLETLGTTNIMRRQKALRVWFADAETSVGTDAEACVDADAETQDEFANARRFFSLDASFLPGKLGVALGMMRLHGLSVKEKYFLLRFAARLQFALVRPEGKTAREFLLAEKQSERVIKRLWEPIILATINASVAESSATLFVTVMRLAFFGGSEAAQMLIATTGLDAVLKPLPAWLEERGSLFRQGFVSEILVSNESHVHGVKLKSGEKLSADAVVSTVPHHIFLKLLPDEILSKPDWKVLVGISSSPILSVYLWFDREFVEQDFIALLGTTVQWVFNRRKLCHAEKAVVERFPCHLSLTVSAAENFAEANQQTIIETCVEELRTVFPKARTATLLHARVIREKNATPLFTPSNEKERPEAKTALQGLFLAGDWTDTGLPATIEGAALSGENAAKSVVAWFGR